MGNQMSYICGCNDKNNTLKNEHVVPECYYKTTNEKTETMLLNGKLSEKTKKGNPLSTVEVETMEQTNPADVKQDLAFSSKSQKVLKLENDTIYIGQLVNDKRNGHGMVKNSNGDLIYEGNFQDDLYHSEGTLSMENNLIYHGNFVKGKREGKGILYSTVENYKYDGEWVNDEKCGRGALYYPDGSYFIGEFKCNLRNGKGLLYLNDGSCYEGEFCDDKIEGVGKYIWPKDVSKMYEGEWKDNSLNGLGVLIHKGNVFIGNFINDRKQGIGVRVMPDGFDVVGNYEENKLNGLVIRVKNNKENIQLCMMERNKITTLITEENDKKNIMLGSEYKSLIKFYDNNYTLIEKYRKVKEI